MAQTFHITLSEFPRVVVEQYRDSDGDDHHSIVEGTLDDLLEMIKGLPALHSAINYHAFNPQNVKIIES